MRPLECFGSIKYLKASEVEEAGVNHADVTRLLCNDTLRLSGLLFCR